MKCGETGGEIDIKTWRTFPKVRGRDTEFEAQCPCSGGDDRIQIFLAQRGTHEPQVWCRHCNARESFESGKRIDGKVLLAQKREPQLDPSLAESLHTNMNGHRAYYKARGISDPVIDAAKLGWSDRYNRYAIPCFYESKLYGIQYRIDPEKEARLKAAGEDYKKYFSEKGGVNHILFGQWIAIGNPPFLFIDESPLDALMLTSLGYPCVSPFSGNNKWKAWDTAWNKHLKGIPELIIIRQNDEAGVLITAARLNEIGRGRVIGPPRDFKDYGDFAAAKGKLETIRSLMQISGLQPLRSWL